MEKIVKLGSALVQKARTVKSSSQSIGLSPLQRDEEKSGSKCNRNIMTLETDLEVIHAAIDKWQQRLKHCVKAEGGHFE